MCTAQLSDVALLFSFFLFLFGIIGVNLFSGKLHHRCTEPGAEEWVDDVAVCSVDSDCEGAQTCVYYEQNPGFGALSYDNCLYAFVTIFQAVSLEGWVDQVGAVTSHPTQRMRRIGRAAACVGGSPAAAWTGDGRGRHSIGGRAGGDVLAVPLATSRAGVSGNGRGSSAVCSPRASPRASRLAACRSRCPSRPQMYMLEITTDSTTAIIYYILVVLFGAMFIVNLFLAVIFDAFIGNNKAIQEAEAAAEEGVLLKDTKVVAKPTTALEYFIYVLIVGNTVTMCLTHDGQSEELTQLLDYTNYFFSTVFAIEMVVKLCVYGFRTYFASGWNTFDFIVTNASLIDLGLDLIGHDTDFLRALRVARVMRLLRLNRDMLRFEATTIKITEHLINLSGVLLLIMVVAAMLGMELFGGKLGDDPMRTNFDYFSNAFVTVFCVTSGEDWNAVFSGTLDPTLPSSNIVVSVLYFVPLFVLGNYVLVNLFIAIICWGWDNSVDEAEGVTETTKEELALLEKSKLELSHNLSVLRVEHADVLLELQELIDARQLGFSAASGSRLMARMGALMKDFEAAADQAEAKEVAAVGGLALGFASLVKGLSQLLDDAGTPEASPEIALLFEYWESEHARTSGATASATGTIATLHSIFKRYITTITANRVLMGVVATLRAKERAKRDARPPRVKAGLKGGPPHKPGAAVTIFASDPPGAAFLPLTLDGQYGACIRQVRAIVTHPTFDNVIIFAIVCSSLSLAFDMPSVVPGSPTANTLELLDIFFTCLFVGEAMLKLVVFGPCAGPEAYFKSYWNVLDFTIVATSVISLLAQGAESFGVFKALRALRTLRPLRVIQRFKSLKQVVNSLFRAIPAVVNVAQVCGLVLIVYGLFGMQFLMGRLGHCNDESIATKAECTGTFKTDDGATLPRWWGNEDVANFDNILYSMLTLFEMSTLEMWPDVLFLAMDSNPHEPGQPLVEGQNPWMGVYIISWIVVSAFFLLNLFVGVVLENFNAIRDAESGSGLMSDDQKEWTKTLQSVLTVRAEKAIKPPGGKKAWARFRRALFMIVQGDKDNKDIPVAFEKFIISLVLLNVLSMALTWYGQPAYMDDFADFADIFFTAAFTIEMVMKITALGLRQYLLSGWNIFDGTLVSGSLIADALQGLSSVGIVINPATLRMLRVFRIARLLRLIRAAGSINRLITTVILSVPALGNVGILLFLFLYIYTILGVELFHNLPLDGEFINYDANFATFGNAMLTLFRCITGESYNGIMHDAMVTEAHSAPGRCSDAEGTCGGRIAPVVFFITFVVLEAMVMLNLIVAVVLDTFAEEDKAEEMKLNKGQIEAFVEAWKEVDPEATHFMPTKDLRNLLMLLDRPLGFRDWPDRPAGTITEHLKQLEVPDRAGSVAFHDVLEAIGKNAFGGDIELPPGSEGVKSITKQYGEVFKSTGLHKTVVSQYSSAYIYSVIRMQNAIRKKLARKRNSPDAAAKAKPKADSRNAFKDAARARAAGTPPSGSGGGRGTPKSAPKGGRGR